MFYLRLNTGKVWIILVKWWNNQFFIRAGPYNKHFIATLWSHINVQLSLLTVFKAVGTILCKLQISWAAVFDVLSLFFRIESSSTWWRRHSLDQLTLVTITCFLFTFLTLKQYIIAQFNPQNRSTEWKTGPESLDFLISSGCFTGKSSRYSIYVAFKVKKSETFTTECAYYQAHMKDMSNKIILTCFISQNKRCIKSSNNI